MVRAGEECRNTGDFRCMQCGELIHVEEGASIPSCPACAGASFSLRQRPVKSAKRKLPPEFRP
jgi:Zn finger protein HypA/HybF involved in hydrogenase expression